MMARADSPAGAGGVAGAKSAVGVNDLEVSVPASGRAYVNLAEAAVVAPGDAPKSSLAWDLAFEGYDLFTNSGVSGEGKGGAFGPLDLGTLLSSSAPAVPFVAADKAGGAFLGWYAYDSSQHVLYSRFHVYGVKEGDRLWKVQLLTYYGVANGAPTSALYQLRYAELTTGVTATHLLSVDGTAGGLGGTASSPGGCLDLATGTVAMLPVAEAQASSAWHLCFRRDALSVNGEAGGPRGIGAVDLAGSQATSELLVDVAARTANSEQALFDGVNSSSFAGATFRGDHVVSMFETGGWLDRSSSASSAAGVPSKQAWLVVDASGQHKFLVYFSDFHNATTSGPGTVVLHIKPVNG
jgi:hypothetical protein